jgi:hypothetical protein
MIEQLKKLINVAKQWGEFTRPHGEGHKNYCDDYVKCYHDYRRNHASVRIGLFPHEIEVALHNPPRITGSIHGLERVDLYTDKAMDLLAEKTAYEEQKSEVERRAEKEKRIEKLKEELEKLQTA